MIHTKSSVGKKAAEALTGRRFLLALYDLIPAFLSLFISYLLVAPEVAYQLNFGQFAFQAVFFFVCFYVSRVLCGVYRQIWRFASTPAYLRLFLSDALAGFVYIVLNIVLPFGQPSFVQEMALIGINLMFGIGMRLCYQYFYQYARLDSRVARFVRPVFHFLTGLKIKPQESDNPANADRRIKICIVGAGRVGSMLAEELMTNPNSPYTPVCFIDADQNKVGREIMGSPVLSGEEATPETLAKYNVQEVVIAMPKLPSERKKELYEYYLSTGCKIKMYDFPVTQSVEEVGKRRLREFQIEDLLFRAQEDFLTDKVYSYYSGKTVLISGGGGSIGSEIARQIARMNPKRLVVLDVYENGAYDLQQELRIRYGMTLDLAVEIVSVTDRAHLERIFAKHRPDIVLHAAAHKHVPLMEHNCCEAVRNNVFGTLNIVEVSEMFGVKKFIMISTDKAVNPTNVMGATKRMCEMIVQSRTGQTQFSATRFGNVLGSNGSVIPLFRRQIAAGGPVTLTDKRIIRYFMTIPEASQLVLTSGAMSKNGELYVLDMGKPIRILDLAEKMIRLSGLEPYEDIDIVETGLRPGEKLYEELLIKTEDLDKTDNSMIFIERDKPLSKHEIIVKLAILREALATEDDDVIKKALMTVVPTFHTPEEVNANAIHAEEMKQVRGETVLKKNQKAEALPKVNKADTVLLTEPTEKTLPETDTVDITVESAEGGVMTQEISLEFSLKEPVGASERGGKR